jgi:hypothetical protein
MTITTETIQISGDSGYEQQSQQAGGRNSHSLCVGILKRVHY